MRVAVKHRCGGSWMRYRCLRELTKNRTPQRTHSPQKIIGFVGWVGSSGNHTDRFIVRRFYASSSLVRLLPTDSLWIDPVGTFADPAKIVEMAERCGALPDLAAKQALDYAIHVARDSVHFWLAPEQYAKLKTRG